MTTESDFTPLDSPDDPRWGNAVLVDHAGAAVRDMSETEVALALGLSGVTVAEAQASVRCAVGLPAEEEVVIPATPERYDRVFLLSFEAVQGIVGALARATYEISPTAAAELVEEITAALIDAKLTRDHALRNRAADGDVEAALELVGVTPGDPDEIPPETG